MIYELVFSEQAKNDLAKLKHNEPSAFRINLRHRLVYEIEDSVVKVYIISSYGHYDDR